MTQQVMDFYIGGGNSHANLDKQIHPLDFRPVQERRDLLAFLNSLNGDIPELTSPADSQTRQTLH